MGSNSQLNHKHTYIQINVDIILMALLLDSLLSPTKRAGNTWRSICISMYFEFGHLFPQGKFATYLANCTLFEMWMKNYAIKLLIYQNGYYHIFFTRTWSNSDKTFSQQQLTFFHSEKKEGTFRREKIFFQKMKPVLSAFTQQYCCWHHNFSPPWPNLCMLVYQNFIRKLMFFIK